MSDTGRAENVAYILTLLGLDKTELQTTVFGGAGEFDAFKNSVFGKYPDDQLGNETLNIIVQDLKKSPLVESIISNLKNEDEKINASIAQILAIRNFDTATGKETTPFDDMKDVMGELRKNLYILQLRSILVKAQRITQISEEVEGCPDAISKSLFFTLTTALTAKIKNLNDLSTAEMVKSDLITEAEKKNNEKKAQLKNLNSVKVTSEQEQRPGLPRDQTPASVTGNSDQKELLSVKPAPLVRANTVPNNVKPNQAGGSQAGGSVDYNQKYLKYKLKYEELKKRMK
jgi:hypothetical protein